MAVPGAPGKKKPDSFNKFSAGDKVYGFGRSYPHRGPVDKAGYKVREREKKLSRQSPIVKNASRRNALLRRMQAKQANRYRSQAFKQPEPFKNKRG